MLDEHSKNLIEHFTGCELNGIDVYLTSEGDVEVSLDLDEDGEWSTCYSRFYDRFDVEQFGTINKLVNDFLKQFWLTTRPF